jgi:uncharacterized DUF497 family protein
MEFGWDAGKAALNLRKHGVSFKDAATVFGDSLAITFPDPDHSVDENRFITIGLSEQGKLLIIAHTEQGNAIRIISARDYARRERAL